MMNVVTEYKSLKEDFVSNHTGTSVSEISAVLSTTVVSVFLRNALLLVLCHGIHDAGHWKWKIFILDFPCIILPTLLSATANSESLAYLHFSIITIASGAIIWNLTSRHGFRWNEIYTKIKEFPNTKVENRFEFLSSFKAYTLIGTVISILAVDFTVYPRRFCKTETYGTGLMDAGVGLFIVSNAVVSPEARSKILQGQNRYYEIFKSTLSSIPLLILGVVRVMATKGVNYQEHVTEYGTHWNFFFTLAAVKILSSIMSSVLPVRFWKFMVICFCGLYQYCLSSRGLSQYIIQGIDGHGGRQGFIDSNREGIISSIGYFILYMFGVEIGLFIFKKDRHTVLDYINLLVVLAVSGVAAFTILPVISWIEPVSRRFANIPYVIWMLGICLQLLVSYLIVDLIFQLIRFINRAKELKRKTRDNYVSYSLIDAVNYNGLLYFLLANVLTGVINLSVKTILIPPLQSVLIIVMYMLILSIITFVLYIYKWKIKFW